MAAFGEAEGYDEMTAMLTSASPNDRVQTLNEFGKLGGIVAGNYGYDAKAAEMLEDTDIRVQAAALRALGKMGKYGAVHAEAVASKMAASKDKEVKKAAIQAFGGFGQEAVAQVPALVEMVGSTDLDFASAACLSLGAMQATEAAGKLREKLSSSDVPLLVAACTGLGEMGAEDAAVAKLLQHKEGRVRAAALTALSKSEAAEKYMSQVPALLADPEGEVQVAAMTMVSALGEKAASLAPEIGKLLTHEKVGVKTAAAAALGSIGEKADSEADALALLITETGEDTTSLMLSIAGVQAKAPATIRKPACAAAASLPKMGPAGMKQAAKVVKGLSSPDFEVRVECILALGLMEKEGAKFEDKIISCIEDSHPLVIEAACKALGSIADFTKMATSSAAERVAERVKHAHPLVRAAALESLGHMSEEANSYVEDIMNCFDDVVPNVRIQAISAIQACGELGQMYTAYIVRQMFDHDVKVRLAAIEAVPKQGDRGAAYSEELGSLLEDPDVSVRVAAMKAISSMPEVAAQHQALIAAVADQSDKFPELAAAASTVLEAAASAN